MSDTNSDRIEYLATIAGAIVRECEKVGGPLEAQCDAERLQVEMLTPIEDEAPRRQATTARGALFQLALAAGDLSELVETEGWPADALHKRLQRIQGCIFSAINVFERECSLDRDTIGGTYYAGRSYVPDIWRDDTRERACLPRIIEGGKS